MTLSKDTILSCQDLESTAVDVPEWEGTVYVRQWTGAERSISQEMFPDADSTEGQVDAMARILCLAICDEKGFLIFNEKDASELAKKNYKVLERLFYEVMKINGIGKDAEEDAVKN